MTSKVRAWYDAGMSLERIFFVVTAGVTLKTLIMIWWDNYKRAQSSRPIPLKMANGVYQPWGIVERVERAFAIAVKIWVFYIAVLLCLLAWHKLVSPII